MAKLTFSDYFHSTALAEAELEYEMLKSPSLTFRVELVQRPKNLPVPSDAKLYALIWTTTPWTLPMNQAVCFNSKLTYSVVRLNKADEFYLIAKPLVADLQKSMKDEQIEVVQELNGDQLDGCTYLSPVQKAECPFWSAEHVADDKGTGLVHTAPAHGADDYLISLKKELPLVNWHEFIVSTLQSIIFHFFSIKKCLVDDKGNYNQLAPEFLRGKSVQAEGNDRVLEHIDDDIVHLGEVTHSCAIDWRTKKPVIMSASHQWFINTNSLKDAAIEQIEHVQFYPASTDGNKSKNQLINRIASRPYWCISRQRAWGAPIPVFYQKSTGKTIVHKGIIDSICDEMEKTGNIDFWWTKSADELIPNAVLKELSLKRDDVEKGNVRRTSGSLYRRVINY